jgi:tRNA(Met) cytidine acetyltransferase
MESLPAAYADMDKKDIENLAKRVAENLKAYVPPAFNRLLRKLSKGIERAIVSRHRRLLVISGTDPVTVAAAAARALLFYERVYRRIKGKEPLPLLYMFHDEFKDAKIRKEVVKRVLKSQADMIDYTIARYEETDRYLGTTFKLLVMDLVNDLKPNDVGRLVGIVEGGGLIVFLVPPWDKWDKWMTIFKQNLLIPGYKEPRHIFITWFKRKLIEHKGIYIFDADENEVIKAEDYPLKRREERRIEIPENTRFPRELYELALTQDQVEVIKALESLLDKPKRKRKAIVITSDRGRGKSGAVGIASIGLAVKLSKEFGRVRIVVTAPNLTNVQSFFTLALKAAEKLGLKTRVVKRGDKVLEVHGKRFSIEYWEPIHVPKLKADIVVVDEAAGMHVPLLHKIREKHKRMVFATTIHGYEGAGRGFSVRFLPVLRNDPDTELIELEMHEPIRYAEDDPIERWLFDALLLDAEPAKLDKEDLKAIEEKRFEYVKFDPKELFSPGMEETLRQLFGIYVLAHYRNEPDDLAILADAPHHIIRGVRLPSGKIVCAVQIAQEGGLSDDDVEELLRGGKTPGNIIPDRTLKHLRVREFGYAKGWRIVRIATHPEVQGKGIGSFALEKIFEEAKEKGLDWVGSGFGVNEQLLRFWLKNGFLPVHMSPDRNPVSGEYTILVLRPIKEEMEKLVDIANREFKRKLLESLHDPYRDLETDVAILILKTGNPIMPWYYPQLTPIQVDRLWIYAYGPMTYEAVTDVLHEIVRAYWLTYPKTRGLSFSKKEEYISVAKVLQGRSWDSVAEELRMRPHSVMVALKELARKVLKHYYGITSESPVGIRAADLVEAYEDMEARFVKPRQLRQNVDGPNNKPDSENGRGGVEVEEDSQPRTESS